MALDLSRDACGAQIDALRSDAAAYSANLLARNKAYLRAFSPPFDPELGEHDQWTGRPKAKDLGKTRSSYNIARPVAELWAGLEAPDYPAIRWVDEFVPVPAPELDDQAQMAKQATYRAHRLVAQHISTLREELIRRQIRRALLKVHNFRATRRKNIYGHSWLKLVPDEAKHTFKAFTDIDVSTVFPVWSAWDDRKLDAVLVSYRRGARSLNRLYGDEVVPLDQTGSTGVQPSAYYQPTPEVTSDMDLRLVWVEDYWALDETYEEEVADGDPIRSRVVNCIRVNGKIVQWVEYPGWKQIPYFLYENENERDHTGFSDVATVMPLQTSFNRGMSSQEDVIIGEARPKFKYRGDADRKIQLGQDEVVSLDQDEDIAQIDVHLDAWPQNTHMTQLLELLGRMTGLTDPVWGRIVASQNSGRALAFAWQSVAARLLPRVFSATLTVVETVTFMVDIMCLYNWDGASAVFGESREFIPDFPSQEPRDFIEVTADAINKLNAGLIDAIKAMELTGEESPDEMLERVRSDYMDAVLHPEKGQSYLLLQRLKQQIAIEAAQAKMSMEQYAQQLLATPPGGAPAGGAVEQQAAAAEQSRTQAAQQAAPTMVPGQAGQNPATQAGQAGNSTKFSTLVQDGGNAQNRIVDQGVIA